MIVPVTLFIGCGDSGEGINRDLTINFKAVVNDNPIEFGTGRYTTAAGNEISIDRMKMYVTDVKLVNRGEQSSFDEIDGYHLISLDSDNQTYSFDLNNVPGDFAFNRIEFAIGVDTEKNFSLDNTGDLDPANDMAWNWDTGYKFFLTEGKFYPKDGSDTRGLVLHIGHDRNFKNVSTDFFQLISVNNVLSLNFSLDALAALDGPNVIDLTDDSDFQGSPASDVIADNYELNLVSSFEYFFLR